MRRTRARDDLHGAVESKKGCKAYLRCAGFCPAVRRQEHILRPFPERATFDIRVSLLVTQSVPNRLDGERSFEAVDS